MEKLLNLLNEYGKEHFEKCTNSENDLRIRKEICTEAYDEEVIISKRFGFIKWLVDNDKIDRLTFCTVETPSSKYEDFDLGPETPREDYTNILLMDLAIQDEPIKFLISILK